MHFPSLPAILPIAALLSPRQTTPNYEPYTPCAENCLVDAAFSDKCVYTTPETAWVTCVCNNDDEQASIARCIYTSCGAQTLNDSAPIHEHNCQINGSPSTLSEEQFIAYGEEAATTEIPLSSTAVAAGAKTSSIYTASTVQQIPSSTLTDTTSLTSTFLASASSPTTSAILNSDTTPTKASSSTPSSSGGSSGTGNSGGSGLNTASLIGTIVASVTGAVGSCIGAWFAWKKYKKDTGKSAGDDRATSTVP